MIHFKIEYKIRYFEVMKTVLSVCMFFFIYQVQAQSMDWWDNLHNYPAAAGPDRFDYISISPGFMGPNALRMPVLGNAIIEDHISFDIRWERHQGIGDKTNNAFLQFSFPIKKDRALFYLNSIPFEQWDVNLATRDERRMMGISGEGRTTGDIAFGLVYKIFDENLRGPFNFTMRAHSKTTTGGNLGNARHTDANMFYWEGTFSKSLFKTEKSFVLTKLMLGFYTYQTNVNRLINGATERQNDAPLYGFGIEYHREKWQIDADLTGYHGYQGHRDSPLFLRLNINRQFKGGEVSAAYHVGMKKWDWNTFSLNYRIYVSEVKD